MASDQQRGKNREVRGQVEQKITHDVGMKAQVIWFRSCVFQQTWCNTQLAIRRDHHMSLRLNK